MNQYDNLAGTAVSYLTHYFRLSLGQGQWNCDNDNEIEACVAAIINAAQKPLLKEIESLKAEIASLKDFREEIEYKELMDFMVRLYKPTE